MICMGQFEITSATGQSNRALRELKMLINVSSQLPANSDLANIQLSGQVLGDAVVSSGVAVISGQVCGSLRVKSGSEAHIHGQIIGDLQVEGRAYLHGMITGQALIVGDGQLERAPGSIVGGKIA
jgi:cytoskeletal protein CcmA (bactofilin family)